jgi:hypothetical protein
MIIAGTTNNASWAHYYQEGDLIPFLSVLTRGIFATFNVAAEYY